MSQENADTNVQYHRWRRGPIDASVSLRGVGSDGVDEDVGARGAGGGLSSNKISKEMEPAVG